MAILENYKLKLVVLIFAIVIWFMVVTENDYEQVIDVSVALVNMPPEKVLLEEVPQTAKVRIKGSGKALIALGVNRGARLELDLSGLENEKAFHVTPGHVNLARSAGAVRAEEVLTPKNITIALDDFENKIVPVESRVVPKAASGHTSVGEILLTPDSVTVSGPKSLVEQIDRVYTEQAEFNDLRFDFERNVDLAPLPFDKVSVDLTQVHVYLDIQMLVERTMSGVPVRVRNAPRNLNVNVVPSTLSLVLEGGGDLLTELKQDDILAYIDYNRIRGMQGNEFPTVIDTPNGVSYRDVRPKTFKLVFERVN